MIIDCNCLMKWIRTLMTWLDDRIGFLGTCCIYICVHSSGSGNKRREGPRFTSVTEPVFCNCSVPGRPATLRQVLWNLTRTLFPPFHLQLPVDRPMARSTEHTGGGRPASCRLTGVLYRRLTDQGRGRPGRLCTQSTGSTGSTVETLFQGFCSLCFEDFMWNFGYPF